MPLEIRVRKRILHDKSKGITVRRFPQKTTPEPVLFKNAVYSGVFHDDESEVVVWFDSVSKGRYRAKDRRLKFMGAKIVSL